jgi:hypothetical protein
MKILSSKIIKNIPFFQSLYIRQEKNKAAKKIVEWEQQGKPMPPPNIIKQQTLESYGEKFGLRILVETGTYLGTMVEAMKKNFDHIYSIELSDELYEKAKNRFEAEKHIEIIHGDSGVEIKNVVARINQPALFWLDGHYSAGKTARGDKDTPIREELEHILGMPETGNVIIIDDARCFGNDPDYPSIEELSDFIRSKKPNVDIIVQDDSIRITPKQ